MAQPVRFPYTATDTTAASLMPHLSLTLTYAQRSVEVVGLLDTGAAVNVLPYPVGLTLGIRQKPLVCVSCMYKRHPRDVRAQCMQGEE